MYCVRELREKRGMTMAQLCDKSGVSMATIWFIETKPNHVATTKTLLALAKALGVHIKELFL